MATPKGMRAQRFIIQSGDAIHIYSDSDRIVLQIRRDKPTEFNILDSSFKVAVELSDNDVQAIAGELLTAISRHKKKSP